MPPGFSFFSSNIDNKNNKHHQIVVIISSSIVIRLLDKAQIPLRRLPCDVRDKSVTSPRQETRKSATSPFLAVTSRRCAKVCLSCRVRLVPRFH